MQKVFKGLRWLAPAALALMAQGAAADVAVTLGDQDFTDGSTPTIGDFLTAGSGEPAPFSGVFSGGDAASNFSASWTFSYAPLSTIVGASLKLGIVDHESAATGNQVASFKLNGVDLTSALNTLFESHGGASREYNIYDLVLPNSVFAALMTGTATFALDLQGPGLGLFGESTFNGAALDFSTLSITTQTTTTNGTVPEPATGALAAMAAVGLVALRRRARR